MEQPLTVADFAVHWPVQTRWTDNDMFGHLNNAVYYEMFDTAINAWININCGIDSVGAPWLGVVAESGCKYFAELAFPSQLVVGLAVTRLGNSSVTYRTGLWADGDEKPAAQAHKRPAAQAHKRPAAQAHMRPAAVGHWVHVYVDRTTRRPVPIPDPIRELLATVVVP